MATPPEVDQDQQHMYMNFDMAEHINRPYVSIPQFYVGRSVFITGGTGKYINSLLSHNNVRSMYTFYFKYIKYHSKLQGSWEKSL